MSERTTTCLYLCAVHLVISLQELRFGNTIDEILECTDSECKFCKVRDAVVRLFVYDDHFAVVDFKKKMGIEDETV